MYFARFACFHDNAYPGAFLSCNQVVMHVATGDQGGQRHARCADITVGQNDEGKSVVDCVGGLATDSIQCRHHACVATVFLECDIDGFGAPTVAFDSLDMSEFVVGNYRVM